MSCRDAPLSRRPVHRLGSRRQFVSIHAQNDFPDGRLTIQSGVQTASPSPTSQNRRRKRPLRALRSADNSLVQHAPNTGRSLPFSIVSIAESESLGVSRYRRLKLIRSGRWMEPSRGLICTEQLARIDPVTFHREWARAEIIRRGSRHVASVWSAARIWELPDYANPAPITELSLTTNSGKNTRSKLVGSVRLLDSPLPDSAITTRDGIPVTTLARTVADCARRLSFERAVVLIECALNSQRDRTLDTSHRLRAEIREELDAFAHGRGLVRARAALDFASSLSESVFESCSRVFFRVHRIPQPRQQMEFGDENGVRARGDFVWELQKVVGEADGYAKTGNLPTESERKHRWRRDKGRDLYLNGLGYRVIHWTWDDLRRSHEFAATLRSVLGL